ncbi:MAG: hypothetical protein HDT26_07425 [Subdoligranulum sp.]|nr:hypothetical protein [Subdoligranulum sp.]
MSEQKQDMPVRSTTNEYGFEAFAFPTEIEDAADLQRADLAFCREMQATGQHFIAACVELSVIHDKLAKGGRYGGGMWREWCKRRGLSVGTSENMRKVGERVKCSNFEHLEALEALPRTVLYSACAGECLPITWDLLTSDDPRQQECGQKLLQAEQQVRAATKQMRKIWEDMRAELPTLPPGATLRGAFEHTGTNPETAAHLAAWLEADTWEEAMEMDIAYFADTVEKRMPGAAEKLNRPI